MIYIGNLRTEYGIPEDIDPSRLLRVDNQTPLGNPFNGLFRGERITRERAIELYTEWVTLQPGQEMIVEGRLFKMTLATRRAMDAQLEQLIDLAWGRDIVLLCWCAPERCHAEVIRDLINAQLQPT